MEKWKPTKEERERDKRIIRSEIAGGILPYEPFAHLFERNEMGKEADNKLQHGSITYGYMRKQEKANDMFELAMWLCTYGALLASLILLVIMFILIEVL